MKNKINYLIGILIIIIDQITKQVMIGKYETVIPNFLNFTYTENPGMAFGMGNKFLAIIVESILILAIILVMFKEREKIKNNLPFMFILAGGIGNLIDRIVRGYVVDFIDVNILNFPKFNLSDCSVVIGVIVLIIFILKSNKKEKSTKINSKT